MIDRKMSRRQRAALIKANVNAAPVSAQEAHVPIRNSWVQIDRKAHPYVKTKPQHQVRVGLLEREASCH